MADQVMARGQQQVCAVLGPQVAAVATVGADAPKTRTVECHGRTVEAAQLDVAYAVAGQTLAMQVFLDDAGQILVLEQQPGAVRFVRHAAEAEADAPDADAADRGEKAGSEAVDKAAARPATAQEA